jgi:prepilin-type N-terminal cleavage/methylation domain-containing protein
VVRKGASTSNAWPTSPPRPSSTCAPHHTALTTHRYLCYMAALTRESGLRRAAGFTLTELAVVVMIIGLLSSLAIWRLAPALTRAKMRRAASVLAADLQYGQMIAAQQRAPVVVLVNTSLKMYLIRDRSGTTVFRERFIGPDTDYDVQTFSVSPSTSVELFPNGVATQTITFTVDANGYQRQVKLTRAGQVRFVYP